MAQDHGVADLLGQFEAGFEVLEEPLGAGYTGHAGFQHGLFGGDFVTHCSNLVGQRTDEFHPVIAANFGETGVFGRESIARVYAIGIGDFDGGHDPRDVEVTLGGRRGPDTNGFCQQTHVQAVAVSRGINRHGF